MTSLKCILILLFDFFIRIVFAIEISMTWADQIPHIFLWNSYVFLLLLACFIPLVILGVSFIKLPTDIKDTVFFIFCLNTSLLIFFSIFTHNKVFFKEVLFLQYLSGIERYKFI